MAADVDSYSWDQENDPFGKDYFLLPHEVETWARVEQIADDNRDALRHHVELLVWEARADADLLGFVVSILWHMEDVDPRWIAEASFMSVGEVHDLAESQPIMTFHCLDCGTHLQARNRQHLIRLRHSLKALRKGEIGERHLADMLCAGCSQQRADYAEEQRLLDDRRQRDLLAEYRDRPYEERRKTREWATLKKQVHRRDRYRCRLCGSRDGQLHVHHSSYAHYAEEKLEELITLCSKCHQRFHFPEAS